MQLETAERVLLVEFINADQFPGQVCRTFPFIVGYLNHFDVASRWLRFALPTTHLLHHDRDVVTLDEDELELLRAIAASLRPDLVIATHPMVSDQIDELQRLLPHAAFAWGDAELFHDAPRSRDSERAFRGISELDRPGFSPHYAWEAGNDAALRKDRHNIYLLPARRCGYFTSVRHNPWYESVELPPSVDGGCAFCCGRVTPDEPNGRSLWVAEGPTKASWIARQIQAIASSLGPDRLPNALLLEDVESPQNVLDTVRALENAEMLDTVKVLVGIRVDRLLELASWLDDELARSTGSRGELVFQVFSCGLESFSEDELGRLNKGSTPLMNLNAVNLLWELELGHAGRFYFSGYRGLSMILFTPWTTLADLHLNVRLIQHLELQNAIGNAFVSRLRLHPDLAVTFLARQDGVIIDEEPDAVLRSNRRKLFREELSWRHLDERVSAVSRVVARLDPDPSLVDDAVYKRINEVFVEPHSEVADLDGPGRRRLMFEVFLCLLEAALDEQRALDDVELIDGARKHLESRRLAVESRRARPRTFRLGDQHYELGTYLELVIPLVKNGSKPALSIERLGDGDVKAGDLQLLDRAGLHHALLRDDLNDMSTLFIARGRIELLALLRLEEQIANPSSRRQRADACVRAGQLYGYPKCCARSWSATTRPHVVRATWSAMELRSRKPGDITGAVNPALAGGLGFVPCSPSCTAARRVLTTWLSLLDVDIECHRGATTATLFHLDADDGDELVAFRVLSASDSSLRFDPDSIEHPSDMDEGSELRRWLSTGDELRFAPGQIQLLRESSIRQLWTASVGLWYGRRSWHGEFWRALSSAAQRRDDPDSSKAAAIVASLVSELVADPDAIQ